MSSAQYILLKRATSGSPNSTFYCSHTFFQPSRGTLAGYWCTAACAAIHPTGVSWGPCPRFCCRLFPHPGLPLCTVSLYILYSPLRPAGRSLSLSLRIIHDTAL